MRSRRVLPSKRPPRHSSPFLSSHRILLVAAATAASTSRIAMASSSAPPAIDPREDTPAEQTSTTPAEKEQSTSSTTPSTSTDPTPSQAQKQPSQAAAQNADDDDDDSDFDELDDVLDNFKPTPAPKDAPPATGTTGVDAPPNAEDFDEAAFMKQLEKDMANMMGQASGNPSTADPAHLADIESGADAFTKQLEESGIPPGDFIKQLLADVMAEEAGEGGGADLGATAAAATGAATGVGAGAAAAASASTTGGDKKGGGGSAPAPESFNDAIHRTINRMKESGDKATAAAEGDDLTDDLIAQLLKAVEGGAGAGEGDGDDGDLTKMFMGMMEQLSNKEMLYEPMKELHTKFGPWIAENKGKGKVSDEDMARYEMQAGVVSEIVAKFEEPGYTDEDSKCREYVWEKMQVMQSAGNPPEELVANPWDDSKGGMPDCPQQ